MSERNRPNWLEIVGVVAIVTSLGLVVVEIRQNTNAISAQAVAELNAQADEANLAIASDAGLAELLVRAEKTSMIYLPWIGSPRVLYSRSIQSPGECVLILSTWDLQRWRTTHRGKVGCAFTSASHLTRSIGLICASTSTQSSLRVQKRRADGDVNQPPHNPFMSGPPPNHCMQPTPQPVIKFAYANLSPVWCAADAGC